MGLKTVLFLAVILALTLGAHLLFFKWLISIFMISNSGLKTILFVILVLLALSFMSSFFLLQWKQNPFTIGCYMFSAVWTGLILNLLPAALLSWIIIGVIRLGDIGLNTRVIAAVCLSLAMIYSGFGVWNAFHPKIKKLDFQIKNLPERWRGKTIVQLSDVHLGHFYGRQYLRNLVQRVNSLRPELVLITGDLFDGMTENISHFADGLDNLKAKRGVYFVTGNHETYIGLQRTLDVLGQTKITVLKNQAIDIDGLQIIGISYPGVKRAAEIRGLENLSPTSMNNTPRIMLFHTPTNIRIGGGDGRQRHFTTYWIPDTTYSMARNLGVDLQLSGHTHAGQMFPFGWLTKLIYKDYYHGLRRKDDFAIYTTSGVGTWGPPMRTGNSAEIVTITLAQKIDG